MKKFIRKIAVTPESVKSFLKGVSKHEKSDHPKAKKSSEEKKQSEVSTYTLKADQLLDEYACFENSNSNYEPALKKVVGMDLTWLTDTEIRNMAMAVVSSSKTSGIGSVYDPSFGVITNYEKCVTCGLGWSNCMGHCGLIKLPFAIPHPIRLKALADILSCFCEFCHRLIITWKQMKTLRIFQYHGENRFQAYLELAQKIVRCNNCKKPHGKYNLLDDKFSKVYKKKNSLEKIPISYEEVVTIISNIRESEYKLLGFSNELCHPRNMIIYNLLVIPPCSRPFVESSNQMMHDDLTHKYIEIVKVTTKMGEKGLSEKDKIDLMDTLMFHVKTLMDNQKGKAKDPNGKRAIKAIKQRMVGKGGHMRGNIQGKRTTYSSRSVITPDPDMHVNYVGMPQEIADKLTYPERVYALNLEHCQKLLESDQVLRIRRGEGYIDGHFAIYTRGFSLLYGDIIIRDGRHINPEGIDNFEIKYGDEVLRCEQVENDNGEIEIKQKIIKGIDGSKRKQFKLQIGDIIERKLRDGDIGIFNRQPTLHEPSMRAKRIKILPWKTFRFGLACTGAFGADFDGDEMNYHISRSFAASAELSELLSTGAQFISSADSRPMLQLKQDAMIGGYLYTLGKVPVSRETFMDVCCVVDNWEGFGSGMSVWDKMEHIRRVHKWSGVFEEEVKRLKNELDEFYIKLQKLRKDLKKIKIQYAGAVQPERSKLKLKFEYNKKEINNLKKILDALSNEETFIQTASDNLLYTGHGLLSMLNPPDFEYKYQNKLSPDGKPLQVTRGVILSGTFNKPALMNMIHYMYKDYGAAFSCDYMTYYQRFMNLLLGRRGFSVGIEDCTPTSTDIIEQEREKCFLQARNIIETEHDLEIREHKILSILNQATDVGERIIREGMNPNNNFMHMIVSGSKGSIFNYVNSVNSVGQQNLEGARAPKNCGGRTLPCYQATPGSQFAPDVIPVNDVLTEIENLKRLFQSRAFISSSFYEGLTSQEFFFLSAGGREGLIDTSVKTSKCGYISRKLLKTLEDFKISYNYNIVNTKGTVVQFCYGDDNYSAAELIKTDNFGLQCSDIEHIVDQLNIDYEFDLYND